METKKKTQKKKTQKKKTQKKKTQENVSAVIKTVKIGMIGDVVREIAASSTMSIHDALNAAGYRDVNSEVFGSKDGRTRKVEFSEAVNGFDKIIISKNIKGG